MNKLFIYIHCSLRWSDSFIIGSYFITSLPLYHIRYVLVNQMFRAMDCFIILEGIFLILENIFCYIISKEY